MKPVVGMGATIIHWTDRTPATIIDVSMSGKKILLQEDCSIRIDSNGMSEDQSYSYERDINGVIYSASLRKDGKYKITGTNTVIAIGNRRKYYDYSF